MADPIPPDPTPVQPTPPSRLDKILKWTTFVVSMAALIAWAINGGGGTPPPVPVLPQHEQGIVKETAAELVTAKSPVLSFGWIGDRAKIAAAVAKNSPVLFGNTPAGKAVASSQEDVYLWRSVRKAAGKGELSDWYPNVDQKQVGCCVGCGWKHAVDVCAANQVVSGKAETWRPVSVEVIYGGSRVEVGQGQVSGDGSLGAWAAEWCNRYGVVPMAKYASADLSVFDPNRARLFGSKGVPDDIETAAKEHPVKGTALVKTWVDVNRSIRQGYPVAVCSDQGFTMTRDAQGFGRPQGNWGHCMCFIAARGGDRPGAFCLNSWGDSAHAGPRYPADMPLAGFWVDAKVVESMVSQGDSYALSDLQGFPARKLDWFLGTNPNVKGDR